MQQLSKIIDDFLRIIMQDNSVQAVLNRLSTSDDASEELDAVQESLHTISNNSLGFLTEIHRFSISPDPDDAQEKLRTVTANLVRSVESFKHTLTDLHPKIEVDSHSLVDRLIANEQPANSDANSDADADADADVDEADQIAQEKVLNVVTLDADELRQLVEEARQTHMSIARRINRFSALLEWESGLPEEA